MFIYGYLTTSKLYYSALHVCMSLPLMCTQMKDGSNYVPLHSMWFQSPPTCLWTGCTLRTQQGLVGPLELCVDVYVGWHAARTDFSITRLCKGNTLECSQVEQLWHLCVHGVNLSHQEGTILSRQAHGVQCPIITFNQWYSYIIYSLHSTPIDTVLHSQYCSLSGCTEWAVLIAYFTCFVHVTITWEWRSEKAVDYYE